MMMQREEFMLDKQESALVKKLKSKKPAQIAGALATISENQRLMSVANVGDYCHFIPNYFGSPNFEDICKRYLAYLVEVVENHGLKRNGKFDEHAVRLIRLAESQRYKHLFADQQMAESLKIVEEHYCEEKHSAEYEKRLNHLHSVFYRLEREEEEQGRQISELASAKVV